VTHAPQKTAELPGRSVRSFAQSPPVQDSAPETVNPRSVPRETIFSSVERIDGFINILLSLESFEEYLAFAEKIRYNLRENDRREAME
jgi:hypothetical protein